MAVFGGFTTVFFTVLHCSSEKQLLNPMAVTLFLPSQPLINLMASANPLI